MTLLIAILIIYGLHLEWWWYPLSLAVWIIHIRFSGELHKKYLQ